MEPRDTAYKKFLSFKNSLSEEYWASVKSEADTRLKIIDPIFTEILGWAKQDIYTESSTSTGFVDYRFTIKSLNRMIVEAKKEARDLGVDEKYGGQFLKLNGAVFSSPTKTAKEGINQAIQYCAYKNAELACVTNGKQWIVFRGTRLGDGKETLEGMASCFGSLEKVQENFNLFYDLLSYESINDFLFRACFQDAEGQPSRTTLFRSPVRATETGNYIQSDKIHTDLDRIMLTFFQDLNGEDDPEARRACFVSTKESQAAEENLLRISDNLRSQAKEIGTQEAIELTEAIKRVQEMNRREMVLLVGTKGAGKTTFIDRFFYDVLPKEILEDCSVVRIDLSKSGCDATDIIKWLDENFLEEAEKALFRDRSPEWEDYIGMYHKEYKRWSEGTYKHLYETDKNAFRIEFGKHIEKRREERPREHIINLLHRTVQGHQRVPCLVFDNADHFDVPFQEEVFKFAYSLYQKCLCLVILPITDTTSWQLSKQGAMQSFFTESYYLPTPPTELILRRRIEYIESKIEEEKPEKGQGYFFGKGLNLSLGNIKKFTACLQTVFLNTDKVANWIGRLSNQDIRRSLQLTREIMASPHIGVDDLLKSYLMKSAMVADRENIKMSLIKGKYDIHSLKNSFVQNIFDLHPGSLSTPLLGVRILAFLEGRYESNKDNDNRYVPCVEIADYIQGMGVEPHITYKWLENMLQKGLALSYDPTVTADILPETRLQIAPSGKQHLTWCVSDWVYLEAMCEVTPLLCPRTHEEIKDALTMSDALSKREAIKAFAAYLLRSCGQKIPNESMM